MTQSTLSAIRRDLRAEANADDAINLRRFFKTGPGEYGEGDNFLGLRVPTLRRLARTHRSLPVDDTLELLKSKWHEERLFALILLVAQYARGDVSTKQRVYDAYLANTRYINNWDLVDASAEHIVGPHIAPNDLTVLERLAESTDVWERRIAMLATFHWIKRREFRPALHIAHRLVTDTHDLIHKAVGWMLREIGKRDGKVEREFLRQHCRTMPRTMLRYAIEKFPDAERQRYLSGGAASNVRRALLGLLIAAASSTASAQSSLCEGPEVATAPSRDLYCIELVPAVGIRGAAGRVELGRTAGPFTVDVTADGRLRYTPIITLTGLVDPSSLGRFGAYVAWAATPAMERIERLGTVVNGRTVLPPITLDKFFILITAEASVATQEMRGRMVLRGMSPSTRLQPPDFMQFALGTAREDSSGHAHHAPTPGDSLRWTMVPMPPNISMLPAEMTLRPTVAPYLPSRAKAAGAPLVQPRQLVRLASGDTLRLTAGIVRRPFKGDTLTMFAFNGQHPGPLLQVAQGAEVTVELTNALDQPTTVHWHGIRLENAFDGVPDLTQEPVAPGGRFTYRLRFPDAGIYWYHPHVREDIQQDLGLYGNLMVRSPRPDYFSPADREEVLMLDDVLVDDTGLIPYGDSTTTHALMGRFGNVMLVNGEPRYALSVNRGEVVRFFLTNVSNTRTFNLSFPGARMKVVASDVGTYEREAWVESVVIAPAERYVVHVRFERPGTAALVNHVRALDHLYGRFFPEVDTLGTIRVGNRAAAGAAGSAFTTLREDSATRAEIARYRQHMARPVDRTLVMTMEATGLPFFTRQIMQLDSIYFTPVEWSGTMPGMNWAATGDQVRWILRDPASGKENMDIEWTFRRNEVVKVRLVNERRSFHGMQHPIHFHGQRFLVLSVNGVPNTNLVWKDTVLIPAGAAADILLEASNPGRWMVHCHIAEHLSAHMMMSFTVQ